MSSAPNKSPDHQGKALMPAMQALQEALTRAGQACSATALATALEPESLIDLDALSRACEHQNLEVQRFQYRADEPLFHDALLIFEQHAAEHYVVFERCSKAPRDQEVSLENSLRQRHDFTLQAHQSALVDAADLKAFEGQSCLVLFMHDSKAPQQSKPARFSEWLWQECFGMRKVYRDVLLASVLLNLFVIASPLFVMNVYDRVVPNNALETLWALVLGLAVVLLFDLLLKTLRHHFLELSGRRLDLVLSTRLFARVLNLKPDAKPASLGASLSQFKDFESIKQFFGAVTLTALVDLPFALLFLVIIFNIGGDVALVPALAALAILVYGAIVHFPLKRQVEASQQLSAYRNAVLAESLAIQETLKLMNAENHAQSRWERASQELALVGFRMRKLADSIGFVSSFVVQLSVALVVVVGVYQIADNQLSLGALIACVLLTSRALAPMAQAASLAAQYFQTRSAMAELDRLTEQEIEQGRSTRYLDHRDYQGDIHFVNAGLSFDQQTQILRELNIRIDAGEHVGLIGTIGSGKTSLLRCLVGLNTLSSGLLKIDGYDIALLNPADLRAELAYVPQEVQLVSGTLRDNLTLGQSGVSDQALMNLLDNLGMGHFVRSHPMGLDMPVAEQGQGLSGGQKQSLAIARSLTKDASMLVFDELTSAMDNQTEAQVLKFVKEQAKGKTMLLSTHRASLLALVDRVIVLDAGKVVADGPKEQVLEALKKGLVNTGGRA